MSQKQAKKIRKVIRRGLEKQNIPAEIAAGIKRRVNTEFDTLVELHDAAYRASLEARMRPRPRRCPAWLWRRVVARVIGPEVPVTMPEPPRATIPLTLEATP